MQCHNLIWGHLSPYISITLIQKLSNTISDQVIGRILLQNYFSKTWILTCYTVCKGLSKEKHQCIPRRAQTHMNFGNTRRYSHSFRFLQITRKIHWVMPSRMSKIRLISLVFSPQGPHLILPPWSCKYVLLVLDFFSLVKTDSKCTHVKHNCSWQTLHFLHSKDADFHWRKVTAM